MIYSIGKLQFFEVCAVGFLDKNPNFVVIDSMFKGRQWDRDPRIGLIMWSGCNHKNTTFSFMEFYVKIFITLYICYASTSIG